MANLNLGNFVNATSTATKEKPKADLWLNVGYRVTVAVTDASTGQQVTERRFVSLPVGIPLDTMAALDTNSTNEFFRAFQSARNGLLETLIAKGKTLGHGEEAFIGSDADGDLVIQLRRVSAPAAPVQAAQNPFVMAVKL